MKHYAAGRPTIRRPLKPSGMRSPKPTVFDQKTDHIIEMDGSMKGLGAVLLHKGRPVIHASRTLKPGETGYSNIEREHLSTAFGLGRLHHYVFGDKSKVQIDHKPLIPIWKESIAAASPQLQCLLFWLAKYDIELTYLKGKHNVIADAPGQVILLEPDSEDRDNFGAIPVHHIA